MAERPLHIAIIGGGLCGLSLAIALTKRSISFTIYEGRSSFTEIGAGINLGPNTIQAFDLIDPTMSEKIFALSTRNEPGKDVWMNVRLGIPTEVFEDGHLVMGIMAPPTGNMTTSRNELLQLLAGSIPSDNARFNKKLTDIEQSQDGVTMTFEDGSQDSASLLVGCDGAHSSVRRLLLGSENPAAKAKFSHTGGYRAVFPMEVHEQAVGADKAHMSTVWLGPGGYVIHYAIDGGSNVNVGFWAYKSDEWDVEDAWVVPKQKPQMLEEFAAWGPTVQKLMSMMSDETAFWATFHHSVKPESYFNGRACMIGDAAHGMCPHQGQGAAQSMEDACVMAEVLSSISTESNAHTVSDQIEAAFRGYEVVRAPRFEKVVETSFEAFSFFGDFWRLGLTHNELDVFRQMADERFGWIWNPDIEGQGKRAKAEMQNILDGRTQTSLGRDTMPN